MYCMFTATGPSKHCCLLCLDSPPWPWEYNAHWGEKMRKQCNKRYVLECYCTITSKVFLKNFLHSTQASSWLLHFSKIVDFQPQRHTVQLLFQDFSPLCSPSLLQFFSLLHFVTNFRNRSQLTLKTNLASQLTRRREM